MNSGREADWNSIYNSYFLNEQEAELCEPKIVSWAEKLWLGFENKIAANSNPNLVAIGGSKDRVQKTDEQK